MGNTIGVGIFTLTGVASKYAGPAVCISFILGGIINFMNGMIYSEFASKLPYAGSGYVYTYTTYGEIAAWTIGWNLNQRFGLTCCSQS